MEHRLHTRTNYRVWVGNFDGHGVPALVGSEVAAPILFDLFGSLQKQKSWFPRPYRVNQRDSLCFEWNDQNKLVPKKKKDFYIVGLSNTKACCQIHQQIMISHHDGSRLCSHCRADHPYTPKGFEIWPSSIATWLNNQGVNPFKYLNIIQTAGVGQRFGADHPFTY